MGKIVYLEGSRAVGKTTLLKLLVENQQEYIVIDGFSRKEYLFDTSIYENFVINEKLYLACAVAQYEIFRTLKVPVVIVKGPYTDAFYAEKVLRDVYKDFPIDGELLYWIEKAKECKPDYIVYLDAKINTIKDRAKNDKKARITMDEFMEKWLKEFREFYISSDAKVIMTDDKSELDVYNYFLEIIGENNGIDD